MTHTVIVGLGILISINAAAHVVHLESVVGFPNSLGDQHFFKAATVHGLKPRSRMIGKEMGLHSLDTESCRHRIKSLMCLVEPSDGDENRECLSGGEVYAIHFERLFDQYPSAIKRVFCSLDVIYVEKDFYGTAYAGILPDSTTIVGIRKSVLDENLTLERWATWKEQLSFGGRLGNYEVNPSLPAIRTRSHSLVNDLLYFLIAHEFGHILDFANQLNEFGDKCLETEESAGPECEMREGSWGAISWITNKTPRPQNDFENRSGLCFYSCNGAPLNASIAPQVYEDLFDRTDFLSIYASAQPWDDFADSLAYFLMHKNLNATYSIDTKQGRTFDVMMKLTSRQFAEKYRYLETLINRADVKYP